MNDKYMRLSKKVSGKGTNFLATNNASIRRFFIPNFVPSVSTNVQRAAELLKNSFARLC